MQNLSLEWFTTPLVLRLITSVVTLTGIFFLVRLAHLSVNRHFTDVDSRYRGRKFVSFVGYGLAAAALAIIYSQQFGNLTVAFGVAGAGIAFALQEVIASFAGWVAISVGGFFKPGDRVQLGGIKGDVIDVSLLRTTIMEIGEWVSADLYTGRIVRVANSFVFKEPVYNYSADFPFLWDEIRVPVKYGSDWRLARQMLHKVVQEALLPYAKEVKDSWLTLAKQYRIEPANVEPMITLRATDNWIEFTVRYVVDYRKRRWMNDHLFTRILEELDHSGGRIQLASATFELVEGSRLDVRLEPEEPSAG